MSLDLDDTARIRVLVVDDSAFMRAALSQMIASEPDMEVVGTAWSGSEALEKIPVLNPDVVTLDVAMPGLDGIGTLQHIMTKFPRPVLMVTSAIEKDPGIVLQALTAGAFDCIPKCLSDTSLEIEHIRGPLTSKIRSAAQSRRSDTRFRDSGRPFHTPTFQPFVPALRNAPAVIAMGLSTGGPRALEQILPKFPANFPAPILIVQHMPLGFTAPLALRLNSCCSITVKEASRGETIHPATAYIAPAGLHMRVISCFSGSSSAISLDENPSDALHIPSIDELMKSVAQVFHNRAIGVIMTGMGADGATGITAIHRQGGFTIGQDEASCAVYGMPRACARLGVLNRVLPLTDIPSCIINATQHLVRAHAQITSHSHV